MNDHAISFISYAYRKRFEKSRILREYYISKLSLVMRIIFKIYSHIHIFFKVLADYDLERLEKRAWRGFRLRWRVLKG